MPLLSVLIYPEWVPCLDPIASQLDPHKEPEAEFGDCRDSMKMPPYEFLRNVPFGASEAARSAPANGAPVATPQAPSLVGAAWACVGSTPLATALLASKYDALTKRGHF